MPFIHSFVRSFNILFVCLYVFLGAVWNEQNFIFLYHQELNTVLLASISFLSVQVSNETELNHNLLHQHLRHSP